MIKAVLEKEFENEYQTSQGNLILLQGLFGSISNWDHVYREFKDGYNIVIPAIPYKTGRINSDSLSFSVDFLYGFINDQQLDKVTLIGNSLGGHIAILFALKYPKRVEKLILTGSSGLYENSFGGSFPRIKDYNYIKEKIGHTFYIKDVITKTLVDDVFEKIQDPFTALSIVSLAKSAQRNNVSALLHQINVPTLLIWGLQDEITPVSAAYGFQKLIPNSRLHIINHCGHVPMLEQPELFNQFLKEFLNE